MPSTNMSNHVYSRPENILPDPDKVAAQERAQRLAEERERVRQQPRSPRNQARRLEATMCMALVFGAAMYGGRR